MELWSTAFGHGRPIPTKYTADGVDVSPPLEWNDPPEGTQSYALIVSDPDAPNGTWLHWTIWNIPASQYSLPEEQRTAKKLDECCTQGLNDFKRVGYGGPSPPDGTPHRYFFRLYALDTMLKVKPKARLERVESAMEGHVLGQAELIGTYQR